METLKVSKLKPNPKNPRTIKGDKFDKLKASIQSFPEMLQKRPIVVADGVVLGGNMRFLAAKAIGLKEVPVIDASDWTQDQRDEFIIKDNVSFGDWSWDDIANEWDAMPLADWGMNLPYTEDELEEMKSPDNDETEHRFANEIDRENNYIVLTFDNDIDWIQAKTLFQLETVTARRSNGKPWSNGIGRVLNGAKAIEMITNAS